MDFFYLHAQAPEKLVVEVVSDGSIDLTTVDEAHFLITKPGRPDLEEDSWDTAVTEQTQDLLVLEHVFDIDNIDTVGVYRVMVSMVVPDGIERAGPVFFRGRYI